MSMCSTKVTIVNMVVPYYSEVWKLLVPNKLYFIGLPTTKLGTYLENRINSFLKKKDAGAGEVTIRVLSSSDKVVEVKNGMKAR